MKDFDLSFNLIKLAAHSSENGDVFTDPLSVRDVEIVSLKDEADTARKSSNVSSSRSSTGNK